jgi:hypothetical protein
VTAVLRLYAGIRGQAASGGGETASSAPVSLPVAALYVRGVRLGRASALAAGASPPALHRDTRFVALLQDLSYALSVGGGGGAPPTLDSAAHDRVDSDSASGLALVAQAMGDVSFLLTTLLATPLPSSSSSGAQSPRPLSPRQARDAEDAAAALRASVRMCRQLLVQLGDAATRASLVPSPAAPGLLPHSLRVLRALSHAQHLHLPALDACAQLLGARAAGLTASEAAEAASLFAWWDALDGRSAEAVVSASASAPPSFASAPLSSSSSSSSSGPDAGLALGTGGRYTRAVGALTRAARPSAGSAPNSTPPVPVATAVHLLAAAAQLDSAATAAAAARDQETASGAAAACAAAMEVLGSAPGLVSGADSAGAGDKSEEEAYVEASLREAVTRLTPNALVTAVRLLSGAARPGPGSSGGPANAAASLLAAALREAADRVAAYESVYLEGAVGGSGGGEGGGAGGGPSPPRKSSSSGAARPALDATALEYAIVERASFRRSAERVQPVALVALTNELGLAPLPPNPPPPSSSSLAHKGEAVGGAGDATVARTGRPVPTTLSVERLLAGWVDPHPSAGWGVPSSSTTSTSSPPPPLPLPPYSRPRSRVGAVDTDARIHCRFGPGALVELARAAIPFAHAPPLPSVHPTRLRSAYAAADLLHAVGLQAVSYALAGESPAADEASLALAYALGGVPHRALFSAVARRAVARGTARPSRLAPVPTQSLVASLYALSLAYEFDQDAFAVLLRELRERQHAALLAQEEEAALAMVAAGAGGGHRGHGGGGGGGGRGGGLASSPGSGSGSGSGSGVGGFLAGVGRRFGLKGRSGAATAVDDDAASFEDVGTDHLAMAAAPDFQWARGEEVDDEAAAAAVATRREHPAPVPSRPLLRLVEHAVGSVSPFPRFLSSLQRPLFSGIGGDSAAVHAAYGVPPHAYDDATLLPLLLGGPGKADAHPAAAPALASAVAGLAPILEAAAVSAGLAAPPPGVPAPSAALLAAATAHLRLGGGAGDAAARRLREAVAAYASPSPSSSSGASRFSLAPSDFVRPWHPAAEQRGHALVIPLALPLHRIAFEFVLPQSALVMPAAVRRGLGAPAEDGGGGGGGGEERGGAAPSPLSRMMRLSAPRREGGGGAASGGAGGGGAARASAAAALRAAGVVPSLPTMWRSAALVAEGWTVVFVDAGRVLPASRGAGGWEGAAAAYLRRVLPREWGRG